MLIGATGGSDGAGGAANVNCLHDHNLYSSGWLAEMLQTKFYCLSFVSVQSHFSICEMR
jgi:hypothetical protein